jgi:hypothetical protein
MNPTIYKRQLEFLYTKVYHAVSGQFQKAWKNHCLVGDLDSTMTSRVYTTSLNLALARPR